MEPVREPKASSNPNMTYHLHFEIMREGGSDPVVYGSWDDWKVPHVLTPKPVISPENKGVVEYHVDLDLIPGFYQFKYLDSYGWALADGYTTITGSDGNTNSLFPYYATRNADGYSDNPIHQEARLKIAINTGKAKPLIEVLDDWKTQGWIIDIRNVFCLVLQANNWEAADYMILDGLFRTSKFQKSSILRHG